MSNTTIYVDEEIDTVLEATLNDNKIPFIVDSSSKLGKHLESHGSNKINAIVDGVYVPELDSSRGIGKRIQVVTNDTLNSDNVPVDAYLVDDDVIAESLESNGLKVLRNTDDLLQYITGS